MGPVPLPGDFTLRFDPAVRRPRPGVLIGGSPVRVLRLTDAGAALVGAWMAGRPVGAGKGAGLLAARLVEAGMATPRPASAPALKAAVVVPVRDDREGLSETLASLASTAGGIAVTVVDDGSSPPLPLPSGSEHVALLRRERSGGPAAARNTGLASIDAGSDGPPNDVVVFVDAGCVLPPGWLPALGSHFADPGLGAAGPRVRSRPSGGSPVRVARYEEARSPIDLGPVGAPVRPGSAVPYLPTAVLAVRVEALRRLGGFDGHLRFGEDVDLVWRLHEAGWRVRYDPSVSATHPARAGYRLWLRQRFDYGRSAAPLAARHGRAVAPLTVSPWSLSAWCFAATGRPLAAAAIVAGSAQVLARRAGPDPAVAGELRRLAVSGNLRAAGPIASAIRRAWLPPALVAGAVVWSKTGRRTRRWMAATAAAVAAGPGLTDWSGRRPGTGPLTWAAWCLADDLAYQAGVWSGAVRERSAAALLPRW